MAQSQFRSRRKVSGTRYVAIRKKRLCELGGLPALTQIGEKKLQIKRVMGGNKKTSLLKTQNVIVQENGKSQILPIINVEGNPANIHYTRRNIITKGAIVKTEKGNVKITSRPGQTGSLFGVLIK